MASLRGKLKQYLLIVESLERRPGQTSQELLGQLADEGFDMSKRTFLRNIESLRDEFGVEIICERTTNTYFINEEGSENIETFIGFLKSAIQAQFLVDSVKNFKSISKNIQLSETSSLKGLELLQPLLEAVSEMRTIKFKHINYISDNKKEKEFYIQPHLLKEYLNRWYVFGYVPMLEDFRIFGVDRIMQLELSNETFKLKEGYDPKDFFNNTIGVTYGMAEPIILKIKVKGYSADLIRSKPWHHSQNEIEPEIFTWFLTPNHELKQRIISLTSDAEVLEPEWFKNEIKDLLEETIKNYK